jgi:uncharacterized protein (DUF302 family)
MYTDGRRLRMTAEKKIAFRTIVDLPYAQALEQVIAALKEEGFGVLTSVDVRKTMKERLDVDFRDYTIIGACNPPLSHRALNENTEAGLVLPCNVIVYEKDGKTAVAIANPVVMMGTLGDRALDPVIQEARTRLEHVIAQLSPG